MNCIAGASNTEIEMTCRVFNKGGSFKPSSQVKLFSNKYMLLLIANGVSTFCISH